MRRAFLALLFSVSSVLCVASAFPALAFDPVTPGKTLVFPRDAGAHPGHRLEWWYITGHLDSDRGPLGFQVTFFRVRNPAAEGNASRFSPSQLLFAHAALGDPARGRLLHDQRTARSIEGLVEAKTTDTDVRIDDWSLRREANAYRTRIAGEEFTLELELLPTQPVLLQGDRGFSRKGPDAAQASYYYSEPHLVVSGRVKTRDRDEKVRGVAWLDHEWSSETLAADAAGWDWLGLNLDDGGALTAFRVRARNGDALWSSATVRAKGGEPVAVPSAAIAFTVRRTWRSPRTGAAYPVAMDLRVGERTWRIEPLFDDQELDARASTGTLYWEGAVRAASDGNTGRGYLELTGYSGRPPF